MYVKVSVKTGARQESFVAATPDHFEIAVREKPVQNMANRRVIELVARHFKVPASKIRIINGHHSPSKLLSVREEKE